MTLDELKNEVHEIFDKAKSEIRELNEEEKERIEQIKKEVEELRKIEEPKADDEPKAEEESKEESVEEQDDKSEEETEEPKEEEKQEEEDEPKEQEDNNKRNKTNISKMEKRFSLVAELRNAAETGKQINLAEINTRAYSVTDEGEDVVVTDVYSPWESLYTKNQLVNAGARVISGIKNNIQIPLMGKASCAFQTELGAAADGSGNIAKVVLSPKRITAYYPVSLQLLAQDSIGVENAIRNEISKALSDKLEATLLGSGAGNAYTPAGLFSLTAVTSGAVADFSGITSLEEGVEEVGVDLDACKYIVSPSAKASLRNMAKSSKSTQLVMEGNEIDGTQALTTAHVPSGKFVYGDWSNLVIGVWDNVQMDVVRDSANLINGQVMIVLNAFVDGVVVRPEAFAIGEVE